MNALLFSDEYISERYHNGGNLSFLSSILLSYFSNILSFILVYIITKLTYFASPLELLAQNLSGSKHFYKKFSQLMFTIQCKTYIYFAVVFILIPVYYYFLCSFCAVYHMSQWNWFSNSFVSFVESIIIALLTTTVITTIRYIGLWINSEKVYNLSLYLNR